jgi:hypothetical protein
VIALVERRAEKLKKRGRCDVAEQLRKLRKEIANNTGFWPWMTIQDFLDELCRLDSISKEEAEILAERYRLELTIPPYIVSKLCEGPTSRELLNEFLHYSFSGWSTLQEYKERFLEELQRWGANEVTDQKRFRRLSTKVLNAGRMKGDRLRMARSLQSRPHAGSPKFQLLRLPEVLSRSCGL